MSNLPKLRFSGFEDEWVRVKLSSILFEHKKRNFSGDYDKTHVLSVTRDHGLLNQIEYLGRSYAGASVHNYHIAQLGDLVYTKSPLKPNPYGIIKANRYKTGIVSTLYAVYSIKVTHSHIFLDYYFTLDDHTNKYLRPLVNKGAKNDMKVNNEHVLTGHIYTTDIKEQTKIADFLTLIDKKITKQDEKVVALEQYKKGLMQRIFSREIRFKDNNGEYYPEWEKLMIGDIYNERSERGFLDLDLISVTINDGIKKRSHIDKKDNSSEDKSNYKLVEVNDLVYNSMRMWQGASGISPYRGITSPAYTVLKNKTAVCHRFMGHLFKTYEMINIFRMHSQGLTSDTWNLKYPQLSKIYLRLPTIPEQTKIANFLSHYDGKIEKEKAKLETLREQKKGLLQQMFV